MAHHPITQATAGRPPLHRVILTGRTVAVLLVIGVLAAWETAVTLLQTSVYLFPGPTVIVRFLLGHWRTLLMAGGVTLAEALADMLLAYDALTAPVDVAQAFTNQFLRGR